MVETEYLSLVKFASQRRPQIIRLLQFNHREAMPAEIEDAFEAALIVFSDREKIEKLERPEQPFRWLLKTAERMYQRERRRKHGNIPMEELATEPLENDRDTERFEATGALGTIFAMLHERYAEILKLIEWEGYSFEEIAEREGKPIGTIYDRYERAKKKARAIAVKLDLIPPPAIKMPDALKIIFRNNGLVMRKNGLNQALIFEY